MIFFDMLSSAGAFKTVSETCCNSYENVTIIYLFHFIWTTQPSSTTFNLKCAKRHKLTSHTYEKFQNSVGPPAGSEL